MIFQAGSRHLIRYMVIDGDISSIFFTCIMWKEETIRPLDVEVCPWPSYVGDETTSALHTYSARSRTSPNVSYGRKKNSVVRFSDL